MSPFFDLPIVFIVLTLHMTCAPLLFKFLRKIGMCGGNDDIGGMLIAFFGLGGFVVFVAYGIVIGLLAIIVSSPFALMLQMSYSAFYQSLFETVYDNPFFIVTSGVIAAFSYFIYWVWIIQEIFIFVN